MKIEILEENVAFGNRDFNLSVECDLDRELTVVVSKRGEVLKRVSVEDALRYLNYITALLDELVSTAEAAQRRASWKGVESKPLDEETAKRAKQAADETHKTDMSESV
jgi:hypothetical protein